MKNCENGHIYDKYGELRKYYYCYYMYLGYSRRALGHSVNYLG